MAKELLNIAIQHKNWDAAGVLLKNKVEEDPNNPVLNQAIELGADSDYISTLIEVGASLGKDGGKALLNFGIQKRQGNNVAVLLKNGAKEDPEKPILRVAIDANLEDTQLSDILLSGAIINPETSSNLFSDFVKKSYWASAFAVIERNPSIVTLVKELDISQLKLLIEHSSENRIVMKKIAETDERILSNGLIKKAYAKYSGSYTRLVGLQDPKEAEKLIQSGEEYIDSITHRKLYKYSSSVTEEYYTKGGEWREITLKYIKESLIRGLQILHNKGDLSEIRPKGREHVTIIGIVHTTPYDGAFTNNGYRLARRLMDRMDNLEYVIITPELATKEVIEQLDGIYLSGGSDSYPTGEFTIKDYPEGNRSSLEKHYQNILKLADQEKVPVKGVCLGNQHISLYNGASINKIGDHDSKTIFETDSPTNFFMLTRKKKIKALNECKIEQITIDRVISAHGFAVVKTGDNGLKVSGKSTSGTVEATYKNLDFFGTQYHPETVSAQAIHYRNKPENKRELQLRYMYEIVRQFGRRNAFLKPARKIGKAKKMEEARQLSKKHKQLADEALLNRLEYCSKHNKDNKFERNWREIPGENFTWEAFDEPYLKELENEIKSLQESKE